MTAHQANTLIYKLTARTPEDTGTAVRSRMDWHIIDCLRNGLPMPQDVYDAVGLEFHRAADLVVGPEPLQLHRYPRLHRRRLGKPTRATWISIWKTAAATPRSWRPSKAAMAFDDQLARQWARDHGRDLRSDDSATECVRMSVPTSRNRQSNGVLPKLRRTERKKLSWPGHGKRLAESAIGSATP